MGSERWTLLYDADCTAWVREVKFDFGDVLPPSTMKFSMDIQATVRRRVQQPSIWSDEQNITTLELDHQSNPLHQNLPLEAHQLIIGTILSQASQAAREYATATIFPDGATMSWVLYMAVVVDVCVAEADGDEYGWEPAFGPASKSSIEKLERVRVEEDSTMCSICLEEMVVGSEATRMPCTHLYHQGCIVEWLRKSRNCPLCRLSLPDQKYELMVDIDECNINELLNYDLNIPSEDELNIPTEMDELNIPTEMDELTQLTVMDELTLLTDMDKMTEWIIDDFLN